MEKESITLSVWQRNPLRKNVKLQVLIVRWTMMDFVRRNMHFPIDHLFLHACTVIHRYLASHGNSLSPLRAKETSSLNTIEQVLERHLLCTS